MSLNYNDAQIKDMNFYIIKLINYLLISKKNLYKSHQNLLLITGSGFFHFKGKGR